MLTQDSFHANPIFPFNSQNRNLPFVKSFLIFESAYISESISQG